MIHPNFLDLDLDNSESASNATVVSAIVDNVFDFLMNRFIKYVLN